MARARPRIPVTRDSGEDWRPRIDLTQSNQHPCPFPRGWYAQSDGRKVMLDKTKGGVESGQLRAFVERIERLEEEKRTIADDIKDVYAEAKGNGFDVKIMRKVVSLRRQDLNKRREEEEILDLYLSALGMHAAA
jgi:uncharacterized protein (UPF0335 family)